MQDSAGRKNNWHRLQTDEFVLLCLIDSKLNAVVSKTLPFDYNLTLLEQLKNEGIISEIDYNHAIKQMRLL